MVFGGGEQDPVSATLQIQNPDDQLVDASSEQPLQHQSEPDIAASENPILANAVESMEAPQSTSEAHQEGIYYVDSTDAREPQPSNPPDEPLVSEKREDQQNDPLSSQPTQEQDIPLPAEGNLQESPAAQEAAVESTPKADARLQQLDRVIWGALSIPQEVFDRWTQGFLFSPEEPSCLKQFHGGPCGVIAPVQAYLLKHIMTDSGRHDYRHVNLKTVDNVDEYLVNSLCEIISQCASTGVVSLVSLVDDGLAQGISCISNLHHLLRIESFDSIEQLKEAMYKNFSSLLSPFGALLFLYSLVVTRGPEMVEADQGFEQEPLISLPFGHANQNLVNLILTGCATPNVWDGEQDTGGLVLKGIQSRSTIGFLTKLEALTYCKVGTNLKTPKFPIWVVGSETHLTVLFSDDLSVVVEELTPYQKAQRAFQQQDVDGNGFIMPGVLATVLRQLNFSTDPVYVESLRRRMDFEGNGIILQHDFLSVLFPHNVSTTNVKVFTVFHYNGMARPKGTVKYVRGTARTVPPSDIGSELDLVLRTRWKEISIVWEGPTSIA